MSTEFSYALKPEDISLFLSKLSCKASNSKCLSDSEGPRVFLQNSFGDDLSFLPKAYLTYRFGYRSMYNVNSEA